MSERLTERDEYGNADIIGVDSSELQGSLEFDELNLVTNALNKLADYEDAEREGRVVVLPCKVGDTVYKLWYTPCRNGNDYPDGMMCDGCMDACDIKEAVIPFKFYNQKHIRDMLDSYGKHWYLTEAEAERALAATEPKGDAT